jgi:hypothetical protein
MNTKYREVILASWDDEGTTPPDYSAGTRPISGEFALFRWKRYLKT